MSKRKRTNPNRIPLTEAHIKRVSKQVYMDALRDSMTIFFTALLDKEGMNLADIQRIYAEAEAVSESVRDGYCTLADLRQVLKEEADIQFGR